MHTYLNCRDVMRVKIIEGRIHLPKRVRDKMRVDGVYELILVGEQSY